MADTQTPNLLLTNQTEGGNNNTWGQIADANFEEIDDKFGDVTPISTTGGTTTLTDAQEIVNAIVLTGTLVSNVTVVFSGRGGSWVIQNNTTGSYTVTCKKTGQTGVTVDQGSSTIVFFNGTDIDYAVKSAAATAEVTVASASTADVLGAASEFVAVSGTTTVTSFGTGTNRKRFVRATGAFKITHHATTLICPGGQDIQCAAGDTFVIVGDSSSNVRIYSFQRAAAPPQALPIGAVIDYAGSTAPSFWLFAYGQNVSRTTYAALFAAISTTYGVGDGVTTFTLPDLRGRVVAGKDDMGGSSANRLTDQTDGLNGDTLGDTGGAETTTIAQANLPNVSLSSGSLSASSSTSVSISGGVYGGTTFTGWGSDGGGLSGPVNASLVAASATTTTTLSGTVPLGGSGTAVNNVQPTIILQKIIFAGV